VQATKESLQEKGFQAEVDEMLKKEIGRECWKKFILIVLDEIKVKESLVYDKHTAKVIGFVELDNIDEYISRMEQSNGNYKPPIATHVLTLMVRGIFTSCRFPYAHFPTASLTGDQIFPIVWEAVERLERLGLKVVAITADGAGPNRKFFHSFLFK